MMRRFAKVSPTFWIGKTGRQLRGLGIDAQLVALYLMTSPHSTMMGIYYLPIDYIAHDTGIPFEGASKGLNQLCDINFCRFDAATEYVWVHEMAFYQIGEQLKPNDKRVVAVNEGYLALPDLPFLADFFEKYRDYFHLTHSRSDTVIDRNCVDIVNPSEAPSKELRSKEKEKEKEKEKDKEKKKNLVAPARPCLHKISTEIHQIFNHWKSAMNHPHAKLDDKRKVIIQKALHFGYSVDQLCHAITGCSYTPHNMGDNDRDQRYDGLQVILRDGDQIDRFIHNCYQPPRPSGDAKRITHTNRSVMEEWLADKMATEGECYASA